MEYSQIAAAQAQIDAEIDLADLHEGIKQEIIDECEEIIAAMEQKENARWVTLVNETLDLDIEDWITEQISGGKAFGDQLRDYMFYGMNINHRVLMDEILLLVDWEEIITKRLGGITMNNADMPAMAHMEYNPDNQPIAYYSGLTKREYFAAMAMQGMLSNPEKEYDPDTLTEEAVGHADWLLKALEE